MNKVLHLIYNPLSGRGTANQLSDVAKKVCDAHGWELKTHPISDVTNIDSVIKKAVRDAEKDQGTVAAAGGDGTLRAVVQEVKDRPLRFAAIPCGTFNIFARTHGIPEEAEKAIELALTGESRPVRIGQINDEIFLINANLGLYAKAIQDRKARTERWGRHRIVAMLSTLVSLLKGHQTLKVQLNVEKSVQNLKTQMIFIGNSPMQLENLDLDFGKKDKLAVFLMKPVSVLGIIRILFRGILKTLNKEEALTQLDVSKMQINVKHKTYKIALDGEMFKMHPPFIVESLPAGLHLVKHPKSLREGAEVHQN